MRSVAFGALVACAIGSANAVTFATFDDPAGSAATPLFSSSPGFGQTGTLIGGWTMKGLELEVMGTEYQDAQFTMPAVPTTNFAPGEAVVPAGVIHFTDSANNFLFDIVFQGAIVTPTGFGGNVVTGSGVVFSGPIVPAGASNFQFAFSFANVTSTPNGQVATAAFTSSLDVVPEPAPMAALGLGMVGLLAIRRRRAA